MSAAPLSPALQAWRDGGQFIELGGQRVFVRVAGRGPALLLLHGYPTSSYDWHGLWPLLTPHFRLIAPDMLGQGFSDKPPAHDYSLARHAAFHDALLKRLGLSAVHLLAHDLGVSVAQEMLARREQQAQQTPDLPRIASVTLLNGGLCPEAYRPRPIQRLLASPLGAWLGPRISRAAFERSLRPLFGPDSPPSQALLDDFWALVTHDQGLRVTHQVGRFWRDRLVLRERLVGALLRSPLPLRLINGAADPNSGAHMVARFLSLKPDADLVSLERTGHWPQIEAPARVAQALLHPSLCPPGANHHSMENP